MEDVDDPGPGLRRGDVLEGDGNTPYQAAHRDQPQEQEERLERQANTRHPKGDMYVVGSGRGDVAESAGLQCHCQRDEGDEEREHPE